MRLGVALPLLGLLLGLGLPGGGGPALARPARPVVRWSAPQLADHSAPFADPTSLSGVACPSATDCLAVGGAGTVVRLAGTARTVEAGVDGGATLTNIACPSSILCVDTTPSSLLASTDPTAARPTLTGTTLPIGNAQFAGVTCGSPSLCVAWTDSATIWVSTDPGGGATTWSGQTLAASVSAVACVPGSTECVASLAGAGAGGAQVAVSTDPANGAASWATTGAPGIDPAVSLACPSAGLCVGITDTDAVETSTDPAGGGATWSAGPVVSGTHAGLIGLACPSASDCVAAVSDGSIVASTDPAAGAASYAPSAVLDPAGFGTADVNQITCPANGECLVPDRTPGLATVTLGPPASATVAGEFGGATRITGLACPATSLCVGVDSGGGVIRSTTPARPTGAWRRTLQPGAGAGLAAVSCPTLHFCAAVGAEDHVAVSGHPATATRWTQTVLPFRYPDDEGGPPQRYDLTAISCPSSRFCLAGNSEYGLMVSTHPAGGVPAWRFLRLAAFNADFWVSVSCPSNRFCVAGDGNFGRIAVSTHPTAGGRAWHLFRIASGVGSLAPGISAMTCPTSRFCLAGDGGGSVHWSTDPNGGPRAWHGARIDHHRIIAARCRSERFCVVIDDDDLAYASTDPRGGRRAWHAVGLATRRFPVGSAGARTLTALACAPHRLCLAGSGVGAVFRGATG
jgi:hypothetical protein